MGLPDQLQSPCVPPAIPQQQHPPRSPLAQTSQSPQAARHAPSELISPRMYAWFFSHSPGKRKIGPDAWKVRRSVSLSYRCNGGAKPVGSHA